MFTSLSIKNKLLLITLIPMVVILFFIVNIVYGSYIEYKRDEIILSKAQISKAAVNLAHTLQRERGLQAVCDIRSNITYFKEELRRQEELVNSDVKIFKAQDRRFLNSISLEFLKSSDEFLDNIDTFREKRRKKQISAEEGYVSYARAIEALLELVNSLSVESNHKDMSSYSLAFEKLLKLQELAAHERALLTIQLDKDEILEEDRFSIRASRHAQDIEIKYINILLQNTLRAKDMNIIEQRYVQDWLNRLLMSPQEWFEVSTNRLEDINKLEEAVYNEILTQIKEDESVLIEQTFMKLFGVLLIAVIVFLLNIHVSKGIKRSIEQLDDGIKNFFSFLYFKQNLPPPINTDSKDEINAMAQNINKEMLIIEKNLNEDMDFIQEATAVVKLMKDGDFSERPYFEPSNPNLVELKIVLNELMELISGKIKEQTTSLERLNASLEDKVYNQTQELYEQVKIVTKARDEAIQAQVMKDEFLANMSHEIRTPLNGILGFVAILKKQLQDEKHLKYVGIIDESGKSLLSIINDILDFSKIQSGKFLIDKHSVESVESFSNAMMLFVSKTDEKHLSYLAYIDPSLPKTINVDFGRIKQILSNLLSNAIKFTPTYGEIKVVVTYKNSQLQVSVKDSGIGVSLENQSKIFSAFTQADGSTTRKYGGTGLGLSISSNLAILMDGSLTVKSEEGKGSIFTLSVPVEVLDEQPLQFLNPELVSSLKVAILNSSKERQGAAKLLKKYLNSFGASSILELDEYQEDGYDLLFFTPDEAYNDDIIESIMPAIALIEPTTMELANISHIKALHIPFFPKSIVEAMNILNLKDAKPIDIPEEDEEIEVEFEGSILVAEDNATNQMLIKLILMDYGIDFQMANDGDEAVTMFKKSKFDMVLMDENMPHLNGIEAMLQIKAYEKENSLEPTPIIALTASALDTDRERFFSAGMDGFVAKPINTAALEIELDKYLKRV